MLNMALGAQSAVDQDGVSNLLRGARFELMPFDSFNDELESLPAGSSIAITTSPQLGIEQTVERAEEAAAQGYEVVPHIAARYVEDEAQLASIAERLSDAGVNDVFIPGGDREEPAGEFTSAYDLLEVLDELPYSFEDIGITGYPEGHDFIEDEELAMAMDQKAPHATYIVTQLCYDPETILEWVESTRERGVDLPIEIGIPGVMNYQKLLQISQKVGVGDSIRFLRKTTGVFEFVRQLIGSRGVYEPDDLINGLSPYVEDEYYNIRGVHIYTFNQTPDLESWRQTRLA